MKLDEFYGWEGHRAVTAREWFRACAQAMLDDARDGHHIDRRFIVDRMGKLVESLRQ